MGDRAVIACSLAGAAANRQQCPYIPYTPEEFAQEAARARDAGAAVVQVHPRRPHDGTPSADPADVRPIVEAIVARVPDVIVDVACSAGRVPDRVAVIRDTHSEVATTPVGSINYALVRDGRLLLDAVIAVPFEDVRTLLEAMVRAGTKPNHECFDAGHVHNVGLLDRSGSDLMFTFVLGVHGALPATTDSLVYLAASVPSGSTWFAAGVRHPDQWRVTATSLAHGGSVRVGLGDNFYLGDGEMATSNGELVEKAVRMAREMGREIADANQARGILRLRVPDRAKQRAETHG